AGLCDGRYGYGPLRRSNLRELGARTSRKGGGLRIPGNPRNDAGGEGGGQGVLRQGNAALVLLGLLERRATGVDGSTTLSGRLRWDSGGSARQLLYAPADQGACGCAGNHARSRKLHPAEQAAGDRWSRERCLRR